MTATLNQSPAITIYWQGGYRIHLTAPSEWNIYDKAGNHVATLPSLDQAQNWLDHRENIERAR